MSKRFTDLSEIECPHCKAILDLTDEPAYYSEEAEPVACDECDNEFYITGRASWSWTAEKAEDAGIDL